MEKVKTLWKNDFTRIDYSTVDKLSEANQIHCSLGLNNAWKQELGGMYEYMLFPELLTNILKKYEISNYRNLSSAFIYKWSS